MRRLKRYSGDGDVGGKEVMYGVDVKPFEGMGTMGDVGCCRCLVIMWVCFATDG